MWGRRLARAAGWIGTLLLALLFVAVGLLYLALQTGPGHDFLLRSALDVARSRVDGELEVERIRSSGLLRGFTLEGVAIRDRAGRPFLEADSVQVGYSVTELLRRRVVLRPVRVWSPRIVIETLHGDDRSNVQRIFGGDGGGEGEDAAAEPAPPEPGEGPELVPGVGGEEEGASQLLLVFRSVEIVDGELRIRLPLDGEPPDRGRFERLDLDGRLYRILDFRRIEGLVQEARILDPELEGEWFLVRRLAMDVHVLEDPARLDDFRGEVRRSGGGLRADAERLWLPGSELSGRFTLDWSDPGSALALEADLAADPFRLADLRWLVADLPDGEGRFDVQVRGPLDAGRWTFREADLVVGRSRVRGDFGLQLGGELRLLPTDLELDPLWLDALDPFLPEPLPVRGRLRGAVRGGGPLGELALAGTLTLDDPDTEVPATRVELDGTLHLGDRLGVTDLSVVADSLRYPTLGLIVPEMPVTGGGSLRVRASGRLADGVEFSAEVAHALPGSGRATRVSAGGSLRRTAGDLVLAVSGRLEPLSFDGLEEGFGRDLPVRGEIAGSFELDGPLRDLRIRGDLDTPAGALAGEVRLDVRRPGDRYRLDLEVEGFRLAELFPDLPDPTDVTGSILVDAAGTDPAEITGHASVELAASRVGGLELERTRARIEAIDGRLRIDELEVASPLFRLTGGGELGLEEGAPAGEMAFGWEVESLENLRPLLGDEDRIDPTGLTFLEREDLRLQGIDPDTLEPPRALSGRARGELILRGTLPELRGDGFVQLAEGRFGESALDSARVDFQGRWAGAAAWETDAVVALEGLAHGERTVRRVEGEFRYLPGEGSANLRIRRDERESYRIAGGVTHDTAGVAVALDTLTLTTDGEPWSLEQTARIRVMGSVVTVEDFRMGGGGAAPDRPIRIEADGTFDPESTSDFRLGVRGVDLDRIDRTTGFERLPSGILDLDLELTGEAGNPALEGSFRVHGFAFNGTTLDRVEGTLALEDRRLRAALEADHEGVRLLTGEAGIPLDLAFGAVEERIPEGPLEVDLSVADFPIAAALSFVEALESVRGTVGGEVRVRGTPRSPRPSGELRLRDAALAVPDVGFRTEGVRADLALREDQTVEVTAEARARGSATVRGTLSLADPTDPGFDLRIGLAGFQAVDRRDLTVRLGGEVTLAGSYRAPRIGGGVRVEQGVLILEEVARAATVVDITDPAFRDVVDTTLVAGRSPGETTENPFLRQLVVEVDLTLQRDFWLRSRDMNVELAGDLVVTFHRPNRELLLVGTLEAVRGTYVAFGRTFQVDEGTVDFPGTPGINPALNIQAVNRVRARGGAGGGESLNVIASVEGTLERPRVSLTSDAEPPIPESDLISYLIFGRPSEALAGGERSVLEGAAVDFGVGTVATQLGALMAREFGVDYLAVTQTGSDGVGLGDAFAETQIEVGQYVGENVFLAIMLRPLTGFGASSQSQIPGARVEWRFSDHWTTEAFVEDRFARQGITGFGDVGVRLSKVWGLAIFRDWTY